MKTPRHRSAFTLIELLVVISIIGILASLAFPAINGALDSARRTQAKNDVVQIATAITAYETEYGRLPDATGTVDGTLVKVLTGETKGPNTDNPRGIVFLEVQEAKSKKSGTNASGNFVDPWGNTYRIAVDDDYDHVIPAAGRAPGPTASNLRKKVAVWNEPSENANRRSVVSWE